MKNVKLFSRVIIIALLFIVFGVCIVLSKQAEVYTNQTSESDTTITTEQTEETTSSETESTTETTTSTDTTSTTTTEETTTTTTTTTETTTTSDSTTTKEQTVAAPAVPAGYVVYKPRTHYIHRSTCHWVDKTCKKVETAHGLECRRCSECKPDLKIEKEYVVTTTTKTTKKKTTTTTTTKTTSKSASKYNVTQSEIILLQKLVQNEYGADWVSKYDKACIVASIMNQVKDKRFPNTVTKCIYKSCVPYGFNPNKSRKITQSVKDAVQYYFDNANTVFANWKCNSWYGDGKRNHFYRA